MPPSSVAPPSCSTCVARYLWHALSSISITFLHILVYQYLFLVLKYSYAFWTFSLPYSVIFIASLCYCSCSLWNTNNVVAILYMYYPMNVVVSKLWDSLFDLTSIEVISRAFMKFISLKYWYRNCIMFDAYSGRGNGETSTPVAMKTRRIVRGVLYVISFYLF